MKNGIFLGTLGVGLSIVMLGLGYAAGSGQFPPSAADAAPVTSETAATTEAASPATGAMSDEKRKEIELIVRDYLVDNPEILIDMQTALEEKQREQQQVAQGEVIRNAADQLFHSGYDGIVGNPDGDKTVVEFFDYNCGYCARALDDMQAMVDADPELRFVLKEFPIFGDKSHGAHVVSMAVHKIAPDKYAAFHAQLLGGEGQADEAAAMAIAGSLGIDEAQLREAMQSPEIEAAFRQTYDLANQLQISGTPSYVIGDEVVAGALGRDMLTQKVETATSCEDGAC